MEINGHLDWLSVTFPTNTYPNECVPKQVIGYPFRRTGEGAHGYRERVENDIGLVVMYDGSKEQGVHAVFSGSALAAIRARGVTDRELCQHIDWGSGRASRIDLAINIHGGEMTVDDFAKEYQEGRVKTPARSGLHRKGINSGDNNFTIGNRESERYLRCYDKNAEQHIVDKSAWLRLELEVKKLRARALLHVLSDQENTRAVINSAMGDFIDVTGENEIAEAIKDQGVEIPYRPRKITGTYRWLCEDIIPIMAAYACEHPDDNARQTFMTLLDAEMDNYRRCHLLST